MSTFHTRDAAQSAQQQGRCIIRHKTTLRAFKFILSRVKLRYLMILYLVTQGRSKVLDTKLLKLHHFLLRQSLMQLLNSQKLANVFDLKFLM